MQKALRAGELFLMKLQGHLGFKEINLFEEGWEPFQPYVYSGKQANNLIYNNIVTQTCSLILNL